MNPILSQVLTPNNKDDIEGLPPSEKNIKERKT